MKRLTDLRPSGKSSRGAPCGNGEQRGARATGSRNPNVAGRTYGPRPDISPVLNAERASNQFNFELVSVLRKQRQ